MIRMKNRVVDTFISQIIDTYLIDPNQSFVDGLPRLTQRGSPRHPFLGDLTADIFFND